jgi:CRISPR-associated endonuclease Csn1
LHIKHNHLGNEILNHENKAVPADYVSTGNNHHVAVFKDKDGDSSGRSSFIL